MAQRVVFINPPSPFLIRDRGAPSLGILQLAAILRQRGLAEVSLWDMTGNSSLADQFGCDARTFVERGMVDLPGLIREYPDDTIFGVTCTSAQYHAARNILLALKWTNPNWCVIIGGSHVSALPEEALKDGFDVVFAGEADDALPHWIDAGMPEGLIIHSKAPRELDRLPLPARDLVDLKSYCANLTVGEGFSTTVMASRGCPFACAYCVRSLGDAARLLRTRSVASVLNELHELDLTYGLRRFVAVDDIFGIQRPWLEEFCEVFADEPYHFRVNCRANCLHYDLLPSMKRAGIDVISFGFESGDERVLNAISKNTVAMNTQAVHACHDAGIAVKAYLIWGFESDDVASAAATKRWIEDARPDSAQVATLIPLPGTPIYHQAIASGFQPDYSKLYHNGYGGKGGDLILPWWTDETLFLRDELLQWLQDFYHVPQPIVTCPNAMTSEVA